MLNLTKDCRVAVYTSIYKSDNFANVLHPPVCKDKNFDYLCFTPHSSIRANGWNIIKTDWTAGVTPRMQAKKYKVFPHRYLQGYNFSIWLDGSFAIKDSLRRLLIAKMKDKECPFVLFRNYQDNCIYISANRCIGTGFGDPEKIKTQIYAYSDKGFPNDFGLPMCGMLYRQHNEPSVQTIMEMWWHELQKHSERDQLSLPYVLWKLGNKAKYMMIQNTKKGIWNNYFAAYTRKKAG